MTLVLCADDRGGLLFNGRRQSRDRAVTADILTEGEGGTLWMDAYSKGQFPEDAPIQVCEAFPPPGPGDLFFLERQDPIPLLPRASRLIVYRWNRLYPSDRRLPLPPGGWKLLSQAQFPGHSHKQITKEVYIP